MRWKLLVLVPLAAALFAFGLWSALVIGSFGTAGELARHDWFLLASAIGPLAIAAYAGVFVYRHTARRRKTQAVISVVAALFLALGTYFLASLLFPNRLFIPSAYELRHAR